MQRILHFPPDILQSNQHDRISNTLFPIFHLRTVQCQEQSLPHKIPHFFFSPRFYHFPGIMLAIPKSKPIVSLYIAISVPVKLMSREGNY